MGFGVYVELIGEVANIVGEEGALAGETLHLCCGLGGILKGSFGCEYLEIFGCDVNRQIRL